MTRYCFTLQVRPELLGEYRARHADVWPEMCTALAAAGWGHYTIFARPDGLVVGHVETESLDAALAAMATTEVNARWQAEMSRFFVGLDGRPADAGLVLLDEIFDLEDSLIRKPDPDPEPTGQEGQDT